MIRLKTLSGRPAHPAVPELADQLLRGTIERRDFLRTVGWLGVSAASATAFAGAVTGIWPRPAMAADGQPKLGGTLRMSIQVQEIVDPAAVTWIEGSMLFRHTVEFLTKVDAENVTHPYLATSWDPSADLKTWRFKLQPNVKWSNGDDFTTEDVAYNFKRWTAADSKSSNKTSFAPVQSLEVVSPTEFVLHLDRPMLAIPEMLFAYTCAILHRSFDKTGANFPKNPIGTGPYDMVEYGVGQKATFKRREGYWGPRPYLDEIRFVDLGADVAPTIAALAAGQVDIVMRATAADLDLVKKLPNVQLSTVHTAQTVCLRMQTDQKPFDDIRVRQAMVLAADPQRMLDLAYRGYGLLGENHHVASSQPEYAKLPAVKRDVAKAKQLLADAGYKDGLDTAISVGNTQGRFEQDTAQVLAQNVAEAGIRVKLNVMPPSEYWPIWDKTPFGLTFWAHRPLGIMTLDLAYRSTAAWNESHFRSAEFDSSLDAAMGMIDPKARAQQMAKVEKLLQDAAVMVQPYFGDKFTAASTRVKGFKLHPADYWDYYTTWLA